MASSIPGFECFRDDDALDPDDVAVALGVNIDTLSRWRRKGTGPAHQRLGRFAVFYRYGAVVAWRERLSEKA